MNYWTTKNKIMYTGGDFRRWFGNMPVKVSKKFKYETRELEKPMNDKEILKILKQQEISLGDLAYILKDLDKSGWCWCLFYIKDEAGTLRAVDAFWSADRGDWSVYANPVGSPRVWSADDRVFSRKFLSNSDNQTLSPSDTLSLEKAIEVCKENGLVVYKLQ